MPRRTPNLVRWSPDAQVYDVRADGDRAPQPLTPDSDVWFGWLDGIASFSFQGRSGAHCTVRKEKLRRGGTYWYGYRSMHGRTAKRYIGRTADLSIARLEQIADRLDNPAADDAGQPDRDGAERADREAHDRPAPAPANEITPALSPTSLSHPTQPAMQPLAAKLRAASSDLATARQPAMPLLASKLHPPRLHGGLVERTRLLDRLDAGLSCKLTLLSAPAGFGKTTLVRQWIAGRAERAPLPMAWVALDSADNDPVRFWRYAITACQALHSEVGQAALAQLSAVVQPPFEPLPLEIALTYFLNDVTQHIDGGLLVLEDYHAITRRASTRRWHSSSITCRQRCTWCCWRAMSRPCPWCAGVPAANCMNFKPRTCASRRRRRPLFSSRRYPSPSRSGRSRNSTSAWKDGLPGCACWP